MKALVTVVAAVAVVALTNHAASLATWLSAEWSVRSTEAPAPSGVLPKAGDVTLDRGAMSNGAPLPSAAPSKPAQANGSGEPQPVSGWSVVHSAGLTVASEAAVVPIALQSAVGNGVQHAMFSMFATRAAGQGNGWPHAPGGGAGLSAGGVGASGNFLTHIAGSPQPEITAALRCLETKCGGNGGHVGIAPAPIAPAILLFVTGLAMLFGVRGVRKGPGAGAV